MGKCIVRHIQFLFVGAFVFFLLACASTRKESNSVEYEFVINSDVTEFYEMEISYPAFNDDEYAKLNKEIADYINNQWNNFLVNFVASDDYDPFSMKYVFDLQSEVYFSNDIVSVVLSVWIFSGGAHGNLYTKTFCFDTLDQKYIDIETASGRSLINISEICRDCLYKDLKKMDDNYCADEWFYEGTAPKKDNFTKFYVDERTVTVIFDPYDVAPYVYGGNIVCLQKKE